MSCFSLKQYNEDNPNFLNPFLGAFGSTTEKTTTAKLPGEVDLVSFVKLNGS